MKRLVFSLLSLLAGLILVSCGAETNQNATSSDLDIQSIFYLPAVVERVDGNMVTLQVSKPVIDNKADKLALKLAQAIIDSSYLLEGKESTLGGEKILVQRVAEGKVLARVLDDDAGFKDGARHDIYLDRKIIAITDFEVLKGNDPDIATYVQEDVTTALVNSGQFNVVERYKLSSVLNEIKLSQSGMVDSRTVKKAGKLLGADLILTGTLIQVGNGWNVNLRLINTETGLIVTAINRSGKMVEFTQIADRATTNIAASFQEPSELVGWYLGETYGGNTGQGGMQKVYIDDTQGANRSGSSIAMDFQLGKTKAVGYEKKGLFAALVNRKKRDISNFSGISFQAKASQDITLLLVFADSQEGMGHDERWLTQVKVKKGWHGIDVPFADLMVKRGRANRQKTNQILELNRIESIGWSISGKFNRPGSSGTLWLDDVKFY